jgi:hypothetical protein
MDNEIPDSAKAVVYFCKREQWKRWIELLKDTIGFENLTFEQFSQRQINHRKELDVQRKVVHEVELDIDDYLRWVTKRGLPANQDHREQFSLVVSFDQFSHPGGAALLDPKKSKKMSG